MHPFVQTFMDCLKDISWDNSRPIDIYLGEEDKGTHKDYWIDIIVPIGEYAEEAHFAMLTIEEIQVVPKELVQELKKKNIRYQLIQRTVRNKFDYNLPWEDKEIGENEL